MGIEDGTLVHALVNNGLVNGVCTVLGFIPVIAIVFLFLAFLEDCGYMARMVIFPACVALTLLMTFDWKLNVVGEDALDQSILATVGGWIAWFFAPLGFGTWQGAMATISAEIAKEQATATLAMVAGGDGDATANVIQLFKSFGDESLYRVRALSFLLFNLFVPPCLVAIVATFREMGAAKWGWFAMAFQLFVGYVLALNAYQLGAWIVAGRFEGGTVAALLVDVFVFWMVVRPASRKCMQEGD